PCSKRIRATRLPTLPVAPVMKIVSLDMVLSPCLDGAHPHGGNPCGLAEAKLGWRCHKFK
ncbi:MAG: hypothetical protein AAFX99_21415, partial [Myxococcota bacterium]